jgi:hypothetical protein
MNAELHAINKYPIHKTNLFAWEFVNKTYIRFQNWLLNS